MSKAKISDNSNGRTCVLILGMHRSGTSALAGVLSMLGCDVPVHQMAPSKSNSKGFFESTVVRDFNDDLLASAGSSWDDFTEFRQAWLHSPQGRKFLDEAVTVLKGEFGEAELFVLKDPRICRLVPFWTEALRRIDCAVKPILTIRNPLDVSQSLITKRGVSEPSGQMMWLRHTLDAEHATRGLPRCHTSFEELMKGWELAIEKAERNLDLIFPKSIASVEFEVAKFLSGDLRHHQDSAERVTESTLLPEWLRGAYAILKRWAEAGESAEDYAKLDLLKSEFDTASSAFARLARAERDIAAEQRHRSEEQKQTIKALQAERDSIAAETNEKQSSLERSLRTERDAIEKEREAHTGALRELRDAFEAQRQSHAKVLKDERTSFESQIKALATSIEVERANAETERTALARSLEEQQTAHDEQRSKSQSIRAALEAQLAVCVRELDTERAQFDNERGGWGARELELQTEIESIRTSADEQVRALKEMLQGQRRRNTLLDGQLHEEKEAREALAFQLSENRKSLEFQLDELRAELAASQARRKEAARLIGRRDAELQARFEELAILERHMLQSSISWKTADMARKLTQGTKRLFTRKAYS